MTGVLTCIFMELEVYGRFVYYMFPWIGQKTTEWRSSRLGPMNAFYKYSTYTSNNKPEN